MLDHDSLLNYYQSMLLIKVRRYGVYDGVYGVGRLLKIKL